MYKICILLHRSKLIFLAKIVNFFGGIFSDKLIFEIIFLKKYLNFDFEVDIFIFRKFIF